MFKKNYFWSLKKFFHRFIVSISKIVFGKNITHRSKIAKRLLRFYILLLENISPYRVKQRSYEARNPDMPWLVPQAIKKIRSTLKESDIGFEWGSGKSTIWFANFVSKIYSVEGREEWYFKVLKMIKNKGLEEKVNLSYRKVINEFNFSNDEIENYSKVISEFPKNTFDFVLVDGHFRMECLMNIKDKLKQNGILIVDNSDVLDVDWWKPYTNSEPIKYTNGIWETTLLKYNYSL